MIHFESSELITILKADLEKPIADLLCNRQVLGSSIEVNGCLYSAGIFQELLDNESQGQLYDEKTKDQLAFIAAAVADAGYVLVK